MPSTRDSWKDVEPDPDPVENLGYTLDDWETVRVDRTDTEHFVYVSTSEARLHREEFIIAEGDAVENLIDMR